jgi:hypothetical protein
MANWFLETCPHTGQQRAHRGIQSVATRLRFLGVLKPHQRLTKAHLSSDAAWFRRVSTDQIPLGTPMAQDNGTWGSVQQFLCTCSRCKGRGTIRYSDDRSAITVTCHKCQGRGKVRGDAV